MEEKNNVAGTNIVPGLSGEIGIIIFDSNGNKHVLNSCFSLKNKGDLIEIVERNGCVKIDTRCNIIEVKGTNFTYNEYGIFCDDKRIKMVDNCRQLAIIFFENFSKHNNSILSNLEICRLMEKSGHRITEGELTKYISNLRDHFRSVTGEYDYDFFPNHRAEGYNFNPLD